MREYMRKYTRRPVPRERARLRSRLYYQANRDRIIQKVRQWKDAHPKASAASSRRRREQNPEKTRRYQAAWAGKRRAKMVKNGYEDVDYSEILKRHGMICHLCGKPIIKKSELEFDHVVPISKGGPHKATNIRPSHGRCNRRKGARRYS